MTMFLKAGASLRKAISGLVGLVIPASAMSGNLDMQNNIITNIGNAGTDFNTSGGLTLASALSLATGAANATTYNRIELVGLATSYGGKTFVDEQSTTGVSTSATTIYDTNRDFGHFALVQGMSGSTGFLDLLLFTTTVNTVTVVSALTTNGAPAARTYAIDTTNKILQLTMGSGTYTIHVLVVCPQPT